MTDVQIENSLSLQCKYKLTLDKNAPLIYLIHGRAGTYDVMWTFERCLPPGCNIIAPQAVIPDAVLPHSPNGLSWWTANRAEELAKKSLYERAHPSANSIYNFIIEAENHFQLNPRVRIAVGFSQGGALISLLVQEYPELFTAAVILAGFVIERSQPLIKSLPDLLLLHGSKDEVVTTEAFQRGVSYLESLNAKPELLIEEVGHKIGSQGMRKLKDWLLTKV